MLQREYLTHWSTHIKSNYPQSLENLENSSEKTNIIPSNFETTQVTINRLSVI